MPSPSPGRCRRLPRHRRECSARRLVRGFLQFDDRLALLVELVGLDRRARRRCPSAAGTARRVALAFSERGERHVRLVRFDERFADLETLRQLERVSHRAADENRVRLFEQAVNDLDLVGNLRAAENDDERTRRLLQFVAEKFQFALHQQARRALAAALGDDARHAFGRSMRAMRRAERVVHVNIRDLGQLLGERRIVGFLFVVVADVLQQQHVAGLQCAGQSSRLFRRCNRPRKPPGGRAIPPVAPRPGAGTWRVRACPWAGPGGRRE